MSSCGLDHIPCRSYPRLSSGRKPLTRLRTVSIDSLVGLGVFFPRVAGSQPLPYATGKTGTESCYSAPEPTCSRHRWTLEWFFFPLIHRTCFVRGGGGREGFPHLGSISSLVAVVYPLSHSTLYSLLSIFFLCFFFFSIEMVSYFFFCYCLFPAGGWSRKGTVNRSNCVGGWVG